MTAPTWGLFCADCPNKKTDRILRARSDRALSGCIYQTLPIVTYGQAIGCLFCVVTSYTRSSSSLMPIRNFQAVNWHIDRAGLELAYITER